MKVKCIKNCKSFKEGDFYEASYATWKTDKTLVKIHLSLFNTDVYWNFPNDIFVLLNEERRQKLLKIESNVKTKIFT